MQQLCTAVAPPPSPFPREPATSWARPSTAGQVCVAQGPSKGHVRVQAAIRQAGELFLGTPGDKHSGLVGARLGEEVESTAELLFRPPLEGVDKGEAEAWQVHLSPWLHWRLAQLSFRPWLNRLSACGSLCVCPGWSLPSHPGMALSAWGWVQSLCAGVWSSETVDKLL